MSGGLGMETLVRGALLAWLDGAPGLAGLLSCVSEEKPARPTLPWLAVVSSSAVDWSTKTETGAEVRLALQLQCRGEVPGDAAALAVAVDSAVQAMPAAQAGFRVVSVRFVKSSVAQAGPTVRGMVLTYRFRVLAV